MWRHLLLCGILIASPVTGWCETVQFTVDPANIGILYQATSVDLFSSGLNGTVLTGQSLSLDLVLSNEVLARLFLSDPTAFGIGLNVSTNAGTFLGFAGPTTGFLLDPNGDQFGDPQVAGRSAGSDGTFGVGLASFTSGNLEGANVIDISGVHFDTTFPDTGNVVTDARLRFSLNSADSRLEFGTAEQLPEASALVLTLMGMLVIALGIWRRGNSFPALPNR